MSGSEAGGRRVGDVLVLVVDDYKDNREMYAEYIRMSGIAVETAADGFEGIEKAILLQPDAIVMDLSMPHLDGFETVRVLLRRDMEPRPRAIARRVPHRTGSPSHRPPA